MIVNFDGKEYALDTEEIELGDAMLIKVKTGLALKPWQTAITNADPDALKALYWLMLKQNGINTVYERISFKVVKFYGAFAEAANAEAEAEAAAEEAKAAPVPTT